MGELAWGQQALFPQLPRPFSSPTTKGFSSTDYPGNPSLFVLCSCKRPPPSQPAQSCLVPLCSQQQALTAFIPQLGLGRLSHVLSLTQHSRLGL